MLRTYPINGLAHLVNETYDSANMYRSWSFQPGDIVRNQMFNDDRDRPAREFPIGMVVWCCDDGTGSAVGVLWSGDASRQKLYA